MCPRGLWQMIFCSNIWNIANMRIIRYMRFFVLSYSASRMSDYSKWPVFENIPYISNISCISAWSEYVSNDIQRNWFNLTSILSHFPHNNIESPSTVCRCKHRDRMRERVFEIRSDARPASHKYVYRYTNLCSLIKICRLLWFYVGDSFNNHIPDDSNGSDQYSAMWIMYRFMRNVHIHVCS